MKRELCSGVIPVSCKQNEIRLFLVQHRKGLYWGFPKGHLLDEKEDLKTAAIRELQEETQLKVLRFLEIDPLQEQYIFSRDEKKISKTIWYYIAETTKTFSIQCEEIVDAKWEKLQNLLSYASYESSRALMMQAQRVIIEFYKKEIL